MITQLPFWNNNINEIDIKTLLNSDLAVTVAAKCCDHCRASDGGSSSPSGLATTHNIVSISRCHARQHGYGNPQPCADLLLTILFVYATIVAQTIMSSIVPDIHVFVSRLVWDRIKLNNENYGIVTIVVVIFSEYNRVTIKKIVPRYPQFLTPSK